MRFPIRSAAAVLLAAGVPAGVLGQTLQGSPPRSPEAITLTEAVALALEHHPAVGEAKAQWDMATGALRQAEAARLPGLYSDASLARFQEPMLVAPLH